MKFSEIEADSWDELKPYVDTCLLPITGMNGTESPAEATKCLEDLRDIMDLVEIPFRGRIVTYPAYHYFDVREVSKQSIANLCNRFKQQGYKYIILITAKNNVKFQLDEADLWITPKENGDFPTDEEISGYIRELWSS